MPDDHQIDQLFSRHFFDLDHFYSGVPVEVWRKVLGPGMHYHFGVAHPHLDPFVAAVHELFPYIPEGSRVLDCGCGWGGPARVLIADRRCSVTGVTIARAQHAAIDDFPVVLADLHRFTPDAPYDVALFMESFGHLDDPGSVLARLHAHARTLVIKDYSADVSTFVPRWHGFFRDRATFHAILDAAGYEVVAYREVERYWEPSARIWLDRIAALPAEECVGQIALLRGLCEGLVRIDDSTAGSAGPMPGRLCLIHAVRRGEALA